MDVSKIIGADLDPETLSVCMEILAKGHTNPEALAAVVVELQQERTRLEQQQKQHGMREQGQPTDIAWQPATQPH